MATGRGQFPSPAGAGLMGQLLFNVLVLLKFVAFMAVIYLALHMLVARVSTNPESKVLGFFALVTSPLTGLVRRLAPPGTPESRIRSVTLVAFAAAWVVLTVIAAAVRPASG